ncbi:MAG: carboxypeptidase regulatory-like domain-containing protein [bacterium]
MRLQAIFLAALCARLVTAQTPAATVNGVVYDSIAHTPIGAATVQLVAADNPSRFSRSVAADSLGRFSFDSVPDGRYMLGFFHPMLDSLGLEPTLRSVSVDGHRPVRTDLSIPSAARFRAAICSPGSTPDASAVLVGTVRDAKDGAPIAKATVTGEWFELSFTAAGLIRRSPHLVATTGDNGWFALCNVPSGGTMSLVASRGADSTDRIDLQIPADGFLRREMYLGATRTVVVGDTAHRADSLTLPPRLLHVGDGRLSGTVVTAVGRQPLAGAHVSVVDGPQVRANERGEWTLVDAPVGTRMLEVRAVGYYPDRRRVDVVAGVAPIHIALATLKSVLDTVKVTATRLPGRDFSGFIERARSGVGKYLSAADISRRQPTVTSDLFRMLPGVRIVADTEGFDRKIYVRGHMADWCTAAIYVDSQFLPNMTADELDNWVQPKNIKGIEVYSGLGAPPQFQEAMKGCGSIVIWTK